MTDLTRRVDLPDGRRVVVRRAETSDIPGIVALYERLTPEARHRRFFSGYHPDEDFVAGIVGRPDELGATLVVEVTEDGATEIVGEAEYAVQPDGDGELGITVAAGWRGWLAPYLLDALLEAAASRGVENLRAEVLVENRPMLMLVRSRGYATVDTDDRCVVNAVIGTHGPVPGWPSARDRPRVLVEVPGGRWRHTPSLRAAGIDVRGCPGPRGRPGGCPLLRGEPCPLVEGADLVVHALGADDPGAAAVLEAHGTSGTRHLVVDVRRGRHPDVLPEGAVEVEKPTVEELRRVVAEALSLDLDPVAATEDADSDQAVRRCR